MPLWRSGSWQLSPILESLSRDLLPPHLKLLLWEIRIPSPPQVAPLGNSGLPAGVNTTGTTESSNIPQSGKRKKSKCGPLEFNDLALIGLSTDPVEKLDLVVKTAEFMKPHLAVKGGTTDVTDRMRVFNNRFVHPFMTCLNSHCNGSKKQWWAATLTSNTPNIMWLQVVDCFHFKELITREANRRLLLLHFKC